MSIPLSLISEKIKKIQWLYDEASISTTTAPTNNPIGATMDVNQLLSVGKLFKTRVPKASKNKKIIVVTDWALLASELSDLFFLYSGYKSDYSNKVEILNELSKAGFVIYIWQAGKLLLYSEDYAINHLLITYISDDVALEHFQKTPHGQHKHLILNYFTMQRLMVELFLDVPHEPTLFTKTLVNATIPLNEIFNGAEISQFRQCIINDKDDINIIKAAMENHPKEIMLFNELLMRLKIIDLDNIISEPTINYNIIATSMNTKSRVVVPSDNLEFLNLSVTEVGEEFFLFLENCKKLKTLHLMLNAYGDVYRKFLRNIFNIIVKLPLLETVRIEWDSRDFKSFDKNPSIVSDFQELFEILHSIPKVSFMSNTSTICGGTKLPRNTVSSIDIPLDIECALNLVSECKQLNTLKLNLDLTYNIEMQNQLLQLINCNVPVLDLQIKFKIHYHILSRNEYDNKFSLFKSDGNFYVKLESDNERYIPELLMLLPENLLSMKIILKKEAFFDFSKLIGSPFLQRLKNLEIYFGSDSTQEGFYTFLQHTPSLEELNIKSNSNDKELLMPSSNLEKLTRVTFEEICVKNLPSFLLSLPRLNRVILKDVSFLSEENSWSESNDRQFYMTVSCTTIFLGSVQNSKEQRFLLFLDKVSSFEIIVNDDIDWEDIYYNEYDLNEIYENLLEMENLKTLCVDNHEMENSEVLPHINSHSAETVILKLRGEIKEELLFKFINQFPKLRDFTVNIADNLLSENKDVDSIPSHLVLENIQLIGYYDEYNSDEYPESSPGFFIQKALKKFPTLKALTWNDIRFSDTQGVSPLKEVGEFLEEQENKPIIRVLPYDDEVDKNLTTGFVNLGMTAPQSLVKVKMNASRIKESLQDESTSLMDNKDSGTLRAKRIFYSLDDNEENPPIEYYRLSVYDRFENKNGNIKKSQMPLKEKDLQECPEIAYGNIDSNILEKYKNKNNKTDFYILADLSSDYLELSTEWVFLPSNHTMEKILHVEVKNMSGNIIPVVVKRDPKKCLHVVRLVSDNKYTRVYCSIKFIFREPKKIEKVKHPQNLQRLIRKCKSLNGFPCRTRAVNFVEVYKDLSDRKNDLPPHISSNFLHEFVEIPIKVGNEFHYVRQCLGGTDGEDIIEEVPAIENILSKKAETQLSPMKSLSPLINENSLSLNDEIDEVYEEYSDENHTSSSDADTHKKSLHRLSSKMACEEYGLGLQRNFYKRGIESLYVDAATLLSCHQSSLVPDSSGDYIFEDGLGGFFYDLIYALTKQQGHRGKVIINWENLTSQEIVQVNTLLDSNPHVESIPLPLNVEIIGLNNASNPHSYMKGDFVTRHGDMITINPDSQWEKTIPTIAPIVPEEGSVTTIELYNSSDFESILLGNFQPTLHGMVFEDGALASAIQTRKIILIKNAPWEETSCRKFFYQLETFRTFTSPDKKTHYMGDMKIIYSEGYDWNKEEFYFSLYSLQYLQQTEYDVFTINLQTLQTLWQSYGYSKQSKKLDSSGGILKQYANTIIVLYVTDSLDEHDWARIIHNAKKYEVILQVVLAPSVEIPRSIPYERTPDLNNDLLCAPSSQVICTNNIKATVEKLCKENLNIKKIMTISEVDISHILYELLPEYEAIPGTKKKKLFFKENISEVLEGLFFGETIILKGHVSEALARQLTSFLLPKDPYIWYNAERRLIKGRLILVTDSKEFFRYAPWCLREMIVAETPKLYPSPALDLPEVENYTTEDFSHQRNSSFDERIENDPVVVILGHTGSGKSTFVRNLDTKHKVRRGIESLLEWAKAGSVQEQGTYDILWIPKANTYSKNWSIFEDLSNPTPGVWINGIFYEINTAYKKVLFTLDPQEYGAGRNSPELFKQYSNIPFYNFPISFLRDNIIFPQLSRFSECDEIVDIFSAFYEYVRQHNKSQILIAPRELNFMLLLFKALNKNLNHEKTILLAEFCCFALASGTLPLKEHSLFSQWIKAHIDTIEQEFFNYSYREVQKHNHKDAELIFSDYQRVTFLLLHTFLFLRDRFSHQDPINLAGFLIEGESGIGKSSLVKALLNLQGYRELTLEDSESMDTDKTYYFAPAGLGEDKKREILERSIQKNSFVIMDEINTNFDLNPLIADFILKIHQKKNCTARIIATQNPASKYQGRNLLSNDLKRKFLMTTGEEPTRDDLLYVAIQRGFSQKAAQYLVDSHERKIKMAESGRIPFAPNFRSFCNDVTDRIKKNRFPNVDENMEVESRSLNVYEAINNSQYFLRDNALVFEPITIFLYIFKLHCNLYSQGKMPVSIDFYQLLMDYHDGELHGLYYEENHIKTIPFKDLLTPAKDFKQLTELISFIEHGLESLYKEEIKNKEIVNKFKKILEPYKTIHSPLLDVCLEISKTILRIEEIILLPIHRVSRNHLMVIRQNNFLYLKSMQDLKVMTLEEMKNLYEEGNVEFFQFIKKLTPNISNIFLALHHREKQYWFFNRYKAQFRKQAKFFNDYSIMILLSFGFECIQPLLREFNFRQLNYVLYRCDTADRLRIFSKVADKYHDINTLERSSFFPTIPESQKAEMREIMVQLFKRKRYNDEWQSSASKRWKGTLFEPYGNAVAKQVLPNGNDLERSSKKEEESSKAKGENALASCSKFDY